MREPATLSWVWDWVLRVPDSGGTEAHRRGRFLAALLAVLWPLRSAFGFFLLPGWLDASAPTATAVFRAEVLVSALLPAAFLLNRRGAQQLASWLVVASTLFATVWAATERPVLLVFLVLTTLTARAALKPRAADAAGLMTLAAHPALLLLSDISAHQLLLPACLNTAFVVMTAVISRHFAQDEHARRDNLLHQERWLKTTLTSKGDAVVTTDPTSKITFMNPVAEALTGMTSKAAKGRRLDEVVQLVDEQTGEAAVNIASQVLERKRAIGVSRGQVLVTQNGSRHPISDSAAPITDVDGRTQGVVWVFRDLTQERELQNRVQHAQRLDSLGLLAGGVAHDFNNLLTAMAGGIELLTLDPTLSKESRETVGIMSDAAERAIGLTSQLLTFGRRQLMHLKAVDLNEAVSQARGLLQRLLPPHLEIRSTLSPDTGSVLVDPVQLEQVLLNLAINASDAMPNGGVFTLATDRVTLTEKTLTPGLTPGDYGRLRATDGGTGMSPDTMKRIFEPFFTTKAQGRGTGLGLATVYGIIQQSHGAIEVVSELGKGTTFTVYLPAAERGEAKPTRS